MKLRVHEIQDAGVIETTVTIPAAQLPLETPDRPLLTEDVRVDIRAEALKDRIEVTAQVKARVELACSRCLEKFVAPVETSFDVEVPLKETFVEVSEEVRQALLLALPMKPLCRTNCLGLCSHCGKNLNQKLCSCTEEDKRETPFKKLKDFHPKRD